MLYIVSHELFQAPLYFFAAAQLAGHCCGTHRDVRFIGDGFPFCSLSPRFTLTLPGTLLSSRIQMHRLTLLFLLKRAPL